MFLPLLLLSLAFPALPFQKFVIVGTVRDAAGRSVGGVRVLAIDENFQPIRTIFVDSNGQFLIRGLSPGRYQFRVETTGTPYQEQETGWIELQAIRVRPGGSENYPLDIVLKLKANKAQEKPPEAVFAQTVPENARVLYEKGAKSLREGQVETGLNALKQALELFPDYFQALELLGKEYVKAGQYEAGIAVLSHAVQVNSRAAGSFYALGVAYLKLGQLDASVTALNKSANFGPTNANTQMMLGIALSQQSHLPESEIAFKKALQLGGPAVAEARVYLATIYEKQQHYAAAVTELELYLKEAKDLKDPEQIQNTIRALKAKQKQLAR